MLVVVKWIYRVLLDGIHVVELVRQRGMMSQGKCRQA